MIPPQVPSDTGSNASGILSSSSIGSGIAGLVGSGVNYLLQRSLNNQAKRNQMDLMDYQVNSYPAMMKSLQRAGLSAAGAASALSGAASGSMPAASSGGAAPNPDLANALNAGAKLPSEISSNVSTAVKASEEAETARISNMFLPNRLRGEIKNIFVDSMLKDSQIRHNHALIRNLDEMSKDLAMLRPLKLRQLHQEITNLAEYYNVLVSQKRYNYAAAGNQEAQAGVATDQRHLVQNQTYALQFENSLRRVGLDPNKPLWQNLINQAVRDPRQFSGSLDALNRSLGIVDDRIASFAGPNWKRNLALAVGGYLGYRSIQRGIDRTLNRLNSISGTLGNIIPFAHPQTQSIDLGSYFIPYYSNY